MVGKSVVFKQGKKQDIPLNDGKNVLLFTNDTGELYLGKGDSLPISKVSDVVIVDELPNEDMYDEKAYILVSDTGIELYIWDGEWKTIVSADDENGEPVVADDRIEILLNLRNKKDILSYDDEGNIIRMVTTGDVESVIEYNYDDRGNILNEVITRLGHETTNSFSYDIDDNIIRIDTNVIELE